MLQLISLSLFFFLVVKLSKMSVSFKENPVIKIKFPFTITKTTQVLNHKWILGSKQSSKPANNQAVQVKRQTQMAGRQHHYPRRHHHQRRNQRCHLHIICFVALFRCYCCYCCCCYHYVCVCVCMCSWHLNILKVFISVFLLFFWELNSLKCLC